MKLIDIGIILVIVLVVGLAIFYMRKAAKSGKKCIGCPNNYSCNQGNCSSCSGCNTHSSEK